MKSLINLKNLPAVFLALCMLCAFMVPVSAQESLSLNLASADLYVLDDAYKEVIPEIPSQYSQQVQLSLQGSADSVRWYVAEGDSVTVDNNGLVTPKTETWYWYGAFGTTYPMEGQEPTSVEVSYVTGESTVVCVADGERLSAVINVLDYSDMYAEEKIQAFVDSYITEDMTDYEKLDMVCKYTAGFDYSVKYSGYKSMVIFGNGDCWASTTLITHLCNEYLGIDAQVRYGVNDPGAGSGHRNAVVCIDGKYYVAEAGFVSSAPRPYYISELKDGFSFKSNSEGCVMYQYDGMESDVVIPDSYNESPVTEIGKAVFYYNRWENFKPVSVTIPASVRLIDRFAFSDIRTLENFFVQEDNTVYSSADGVIYSEDKSVLFAYPSGKQGEFCVPEGTQEIGDYALYYANNLTEVTIPESVTHIGEGAFAQCRSLCKVVLPGTLKSIDSFAFFSDPMLKEIYIPESVTEIGENAFQVTDELTVFGEEGSFAQEYASVAGIRFMVKTGGDANSDGKIDIKDATAIQKYLAELITFSGVQEEVADFNMDGKISIADATAIQKKLAGLEY